MVGGFLMWTTLLLGIQLKALTRVRVEQAIQLDFPVSNNDIEFEAILVGVDLA